MFVRILLENVITSFRLLTCQSLVFLNVTLVKLLQAKKAFRPIYLTLSGIVIFVNKGQLLNAYPLMLVTVSGIVTLVNEEQKWNALSPILVTPLGIVTLVNAGQP